MKLNILNLIDEETASQLFELAVIHAYSITSEPSDELILSFYGWLGNSLISSIKIKLN